MYCKTPKNGNHDWSRLNTSQQGSRVGCIAVRHGTMTSTTRSKVGCIEAQVRLRHLLSRVWSHEFCKWSQHCWGQGRVGSGQGRVRSGNWLISYWRGRMCFQTFRLLDGIKSHAIRAQVRDGWSWGTHYLQAQSRVSAIMTSFVSMNRVKGGRH